MSNNRKNNWPFALKLIPGELSVDDSSICTWSHFHSHPWDSATLTSLPTVNQTAVILSRGVNGNTQLVSVLQEVVDMSSPRFLVSGHCWPPRYMFQTKNPNARTRQVNLNKILYKFSQSGFRPIENWVGHNEDRLVEIISVATPRKNNILLIYHLKSTQQKFVCRL